MIILKCLINFYKIIPEIYSIFFLYYSFFLLFPFYKYAHYAHLFQYNLYEEKVDKLVKISFIKRWCRSILYENKEVINSKNIKEINDENNIILYLEYEKHTFSFNPCDYSMRKMNSCNVYNFEDIKASSKNPNDFVLNKIFKDKIFFNDLTLFKIFKII